MLGSAGSRAGVDTASARSEPALSWATLVVMGSNTLSMLPPSRSCMAGALPW